MKKYYIFAINREFYSDYADNQKSLYKILKNLYTLDTDYMNYGLSIYNQLCAPINKEILESYYKDYNSIENHYYINNCIIEINNSCMVVLTNRLSLVNLKYLYYYNFPLFICDFDNDRFSFLNHEYFKNVDNIIK
ncbi:MAG TPA: hypothetical protein PLV83_02140 [Bacilli bacterium]|nr:hypothetical protein [Bacilli bacterium]